MSLLPLRNEVHTTPAESRIIDENDAGVDAAYNALTASTTRQILSIIYNHPSTPCDIQAETETSLQNVHYHLSKLENVGFIQPAGTGYSEKGTEMTLYAPTHESIVLFIGQDPAHQQLREFLQ
ncbi:ArsR/SmtB family transcription factor [Halocatena marina]|uniref:ArsR/SmtB family transcription factor n=1 Tax=Halocatena marina TaxID=2934937 RepID=A0ABD5YX46_9EURY|nr:winged helix-turn-helix domain-containing protein [Halocatena marina]